jgi:hypothetical protein
VDRNCLSGSRQHTGPPEKRSSRHDCTGLQLLAGIETEKEGLVDQICPRWNTPRSWMRQIEDFQASRVGQFSLTGREAAYGTRRRIPSLFLDAVWIQPFNVYED